MRILWAASLVLLMVVVGCAPKQQGVPTTIPAPLVSALLNDRGPVTRAPPQYSVSRLPDGFPVALVPPGNVSIVGGMTTADQTVAVFSDSTRRLAAVMEQVFEQHGYARPPATRGSGFSAGYGPPGWFCSDSAIVSVEPLTGVNRSSVRVTYHRMYGSAVCRGYEAPRSADQLALPELKPPAGARVSRSGGGTSSDGINSTAEMNGEDLDAAAIVAHYAAQLVAAGWTAEPPAVSPRVAAQYLVVEDSLGGRWEGVLMASGGKTSLTLSLIMHPSRSR